MVVVRTPGRSSRRGPEQIGLFVAAAAGSAALPSSGPADSGRENRVKALACTQPLHDLQTNRGRRGWEAYDFYELGLAAIDAVVERMGVDTGMDRRALEQQLRPQARRFAPRAHDATIEAVVTELVETLIRPNVGEYTSAVDEVRRRFDFALLTEHEDADGAIYLRATNEAINVLVGGLNTDIESAQFAAEATLEHLIRKGLLDDAARPARDARIRSIQYMVWVQQVIEETRRDIRRAGWHDEVPGRLDAIRAHLSERIETEERLLAAMQEARDSAEKEEPRRQAAALVETIDDCFRRHQELHARLMEATRVFFEEQDRQVYGRASLLGAIDLTEEALIPLMRSPVGTIGEITARFAERLLLFGPGPRSRSLTPRLQPRLGALLYALLRPPPPRDLEGEPVEEPEWAEPTVDPLAFDSDAWAATDVLVDALEVPARLSRLLASALHAGGSEAADLLRLRALVATSPDLDAVRARTRHVLAAAADGRRFAGAGFAGDDLLVGRLEPLTVPVRGEASSPEPVADATGNLRLLPPLPSKRRGTQ